MYGHFLHICLLYILGQVFIETHNLASTNMTHLGLSYFTPIYHHQHPGKPHINMIWGQYINQVLFNLSLYLFFKRNNVALWGKFSSLIMVKAEIWKHGTKFIIQLFVNENSPNNTRSIVICMQNLHFYSYIYENFTLGLLVIY